MSVLGTNFIGAETSIRFHSTTAAYRTRPQTAPEVTEAARVLTWTTTVDGIWTARIGDTTAGSIHRSNAGFQVRDWNDTVESTHPTLQAAQLSLEPATRAAARTTTEAIRHRAGILAGSTIITTLATLTGVIATMAAIHI